MDSINFTAIDFETANRKRSSACSIGMAKVRGGKIVETYHALLRPDPEDFEEKNIAIHGIKPEMVADKPTLFEAWNEISGFIGDNVLIAHNAIFEQSVINQAMALRDYSPPRLEYICTLYMARLNYPNRFGYRLPDLCKDLLRRPIVHHDALNDAIASAELGVHLISMYREQRPKALLDVLYATRISQKNEWKSLAGLKSSKVEFDSSHIFFGKKVAITGLLNHCSREEAVRTVIDLGADYVGSISKNTDYLVFGGAGYQTPLPEAHSSKMKKALELSADGSKVQIVTEDHFWELVGF